MAIASTARLRWAGLQPWVRLSLIVIWAVVNGVLIGYAFEAFVLRPNAQNDWGTWESAAQAVDGGALYAEGVFVWSPIAAWILRLVVVPLGYWTWVGLHLASLLLLRDRLAILLVITCGGFWIDAVGGNFFTFVFVAAYLALRHRSRAAAVAFLALTLLMPRPVQLPLVAWLLARDPAIRLPAVGLLVASALLVGVGGHAVPWLERLISLSQEYPFRGWDLGPTRVLGSVWLVVGVPLAALATWRGYPGWAGLLMTPYLVPQYILLPIVHLRGRPGQSPARA